MKSVFTIGFFLTIGLFLGCDSGNDQDPETYDPIEVDMTAANLTDFQLSEVAYVEIQLRQPEIVNGAQRTPGEIIITIPATFDTFELSLASVNFDTAKFEISPVVGSVQSFGAGNVITYTITSLEDPDRNISYRVSVIQEDPLPKEEPKITGFRFEKDKNADLPSDIEAQRIVEYPAMNFNAIFILVPNGTDLTDLVPSIEVEGGELQYRQGDNDFSRYPETDLSIDFICDYDFLSFRDRNELELSVNTSEAHIRYRVIVDVEDPIELEENEVSTADVIQGETRTFRFKWVNRGNHPVRHGISASDYGNNATDDTKENIFDAFLGMSSAIQAGFIRPGEEGSVSVTVNADGAVPGDYDVNILFTPKYDLNRAMIDDLVDDLNPIEDIFNTVALNVRTTVVSRP